MPGAKSGARGGKGDICNKKVAFTGARAIVQPIGCIMKTDRIEKQIEIKAPISRVWRALTDHNEFGQWFGSKLEGPFVPGKVTRGRITYPGFEHIKWEVCVEKMEPETLFSFTWHPYAIDAKVDYSKEPPTLVEFRLEETADGTRLLLSESGFGKIPSGRRPEAFRMNSRGWAEQMKNVKRHVTEAK
jgi:uncharacterized protein YndB with AHSA1/START domain